MLYYIISYYAHINLSIWAGSVGSNGISPGCISSFSSSDYGENFTDFFGLIRGSSSPIVSNFSLGTGDCYITSCMARISGVPHASVHGSSSRWDLWAWTYPDTYINILIA